jgi:hypothetical protein
MKDRLPMDDTVKAAIKKMTERIRQWSHLTAWDWGYDPSDEDIADRKSKIDNICDEIDELGNREKLTVGEFESVRQKLNKYGAFPLLDDLRAVTDAIQRAA